MREGLRQPRPRSQTERWTEMCATDQHVYCLTDRDPHRWPSPAQTGASQRHVGISTRVAGDNPAAVSRSHERIADWRAIGVVTR